MKCDELNVTIDVKVGIPVEQAERALKIVEWFLNDNSNYRIAYEKNDGSVNMKFQHDI